MNRKLMSIILSLLISSFTIGILGCEQEGAMEKAGKEMDKTAEEISKKTEEVMQDAGKAVEETQQKVEKAIRAFLLIWNKL